MNSASNKYIDIFIENYVKVFRNYIKSKYIITIGGLADFVAADDHDITLLTRKLQLYGFEISLANGKDTIDEVQVDFFCTDEEQHERFEYKIENLITIINLSSKTDISVVGILVMQIVSRIICKSKILYKAIVLDFDDTLCKGVLAEDGFDAIRQNLYSDEAAPFISFMQFIRAISKELGLYVAICSRNDEKLIEQALERFDESEFPLKDQIDCVVANYNDKSINIKAIAEQLSILPNAIVFIDDNFIVRDEVRRNLPDVFVPDWNNHEELLTLLMVCCVFDRCELSLKSRKRKEWFKIIQTECGRNSRPQLFIKCNKDNENTEAISLYAKSNQFKFVANMKNYEGCNSLVFEIYRDNGENLGVCSALTYIEDNQKVHILNWAISCRYFEIGLEEYILMHLLSLANKREIIFSFNNSGFNGKVVELVERYKDSFSSKDNEIVLFAPKNQSIRNIQKNTNLKELSNG